MANPHKPTGARAREAGLRVIHAPIELIAHLLVLAGLLLSIKLLEKVVHNLWDQDYLFFNLIKLRYIFDAADLVILVFPRVGRILLSVGLCEEAGVNHEHVTAEICESSLQIAPMVLIATFLVVIFASAGENA